jgi:hypothetical protein
LPRYECRITKSSTGRANKRVLSGWNEAAVRDVLLAEKDVSEILSIKRIVEPASQAQLDYLRDLTGAMPSGLEMREASDLIDNALRRWAPGNERDRSVAAHFNLDVSRYASKASIFRQVTVYLSELADSLQLAQWYVYRVYRQAKNRGSVGDDLWLDAPKIRDIANAMLRDGAVVESLRRAAKDQSCGFRWFGAMSMPDGTIVNGESDRTKAYEFARKALQASGLIDNRVVGQVAHGQASEEAYRETLGPASKPLAQQQNEEFNWLWLVLPVLVVAVLLIAYA